MKGKKGYRVIREGMRRNEKEVLDYLREGRPKTTTLLWSIGWLNALNRLVDAGIVKFVRKGLFGHYKVRKYARPVTR